MLSIIISRFVVLLGGALYPAYRSYKTVKTKNVRDYVKWMMYWIVFAIFICLEDFVDMFFSFWFPFYFETKIIFVVWLLSPYTKGASFLYRKLVHPYLVKHERDIDNYLDKAKIGGYHTFTNLLTKSIAQLKEMIIEATHHGTI
uniref:Receptor expression-enhancing protein n=1 Tax=Romanomermis culicivorax TaxID=13658 RepID=A0A915HPI7_ROMCU